MMTEREVLRGGSEIVMRELKIQSCGRGRMIRGVVALCCCALLICAAATTGRAQAGRRISKPREDPPVSKPEPSPTPTPEKQTETPKISIIVGSEQPTSMSFSLSAGELLQSVVMQRLHDSKSLNITSAGRIGRGEANKRAKNEKEGTYVVWFTLEGSGFDPMGRSTRLEDLYVQYIILEPVTGKTKARGNVYLRSGSSGSIGGVGIGRRLPQCYPQAVYNADFALIEAGIETANRIINSFALPNPPLCTS